jgi:ABC-type multidrug transport system fused ATPase/permease subunit
LVGVERIYQYKKIESENWKGTRDVPENWPSEPKIVFNNVCLKYQEEFPNVLDGITFEIKAGEKIGIIGRTGSGKSSIFTALLRAFELNNGNILINDVNTRDLDLKKLREKISIIPQDPFLFCGTLRDNLDPYKNRSDSELWNALEKCRLHEKIRNLDKGLEYEVESQGRNFSNGEKQLICLARAILAQTNILCIDEATASVDFETDRYIQETIRTEFKSTTVLTIAHRLNTIFDYDKVLVLQNAKIAEFDTIYNLMNDKETIFYALIESERQQIKK